MQCRAACTNGFEDVLRRRNKQEGPGKNGEQRYGNIEPERLDVLEFGCEVAPEVVLDEKNAEEVGITARAEDVPREGSEAEAEDGDGMKAPQGIAPALGADGPKKNRTARKDDCSRAFRKNGKAKEETEENEGEPGSSREDRSVFVADESEDKSGADHG